MIALEEKIQFVSNQLQSEKVKIEKQKQELELQQKIKEINDEKIMALQDKIETQNDEIHHISSPALAVPTPTETPKMSYSLMERALFALCFCVLGVLIALVTKAGLHRCSPTLDQKEVNERLLRCPCVSVLLSWSSKIMF